MRISNDPKYERTDIWREGAWLDLWSVVHFLSGVSVASVLYLLHLGAFASTLIAFLLLVSYELWEAMVKIIETPTNRFMDVVVGMASFLPVFFLVAPRLSTEAFLLCSGLILTLNVVMSVFGWQASQKAATLEQSMRAKYAVERTRLLKRRAYLREKFKR